jgi:hypothetical protein
VEEKGDKENDGGWDPRANTNDDDRASLNLSKAAETVEILQEKENTTDMANDENNISDKEALTVADAAERDGAEKPDDNNGYEFPQTTTRKDGQERKELDWRNHPGTRSHHEIHTV